MKKFPSEHFKFVFVKKFENEKIYSLLTTVETLVNIQS